MIFRTYSLIFPRWVTNKNFYSTFQAAAILGVTPDTVLKWIKAGKIPASRTLGGHYRIQRDTLTDLIKERQSQNLAVETTLPLKAFQYCWEYNSKDDTLEDQCRNCLVYKTRAKLCYEMSPVPKEFGHLKLYCESNCKDCDYYR
ncbi:MAG: helix-turn-helix domain-containing protein, partial [Candidatus Latescibacterota bacterium]